MLELEKIMLEQDAHLKKVLSDGAYRSIQDTIQRQHEAVQVQLGDKFYIKAIVDGSNKLLLEVAEV